MVVCKTQMMGRQVQVFITVHCPKFRTVSLAPSTFTFLLTVYKLMVYFSINNEAMPQLVLDTSVNSEGGSWEEDWDKMVPGKVNRSMFSRIEML